MVRVHAVWFFLYQLRVKALKIRVAVINSGRVTASILLIFSYCFDNVYEFIHLYPKPVVSRTMWQISMAFHGVCLVFDISLKSNPLITIPSEFAEHQPLHLLWSWQHQGYKEMEKMVENPSSLFASRRDIYSELGPIM